MPPHAGLSVAKLSRHLLEQLALDRRQARQPLPRDLVEHAIQLLGLRVPHLAPLARTEPSRSLRDRGLALRDDLIDLVAMTRALRRPRRRARRDVVAHVRRGRYALPQLFDAHVLRLLQVEEREREAAE